MGVETGIAWCDATWNPWVGCTKVSEGCANCYMFREQQRWDHDPKNIRQTKGSRRDLPIRKTRDGEWKIPSGSFVFVCSWSDFCHPDIPDQWINKAWEIMRARPDCVFLLLTKRVDRLDHEAALWWPWRDEMSHIWLGVTAENQARADERIPQLLEMEWAGKRFVSIEPQLGSVECRREWLLDAGDKEHLDNCRLRSRGIDWVICGGESGPKHRPFDLDWARSLRDQCQAADVPFFLKQYSANKPEHMPLLDGKRWAERPTGAPLNK